MKKSSSQNIKEKLLKIAKNEIRISYSEVETSLSKWDSKIGGKPAVPFDFDDWGEFTKLLGYPDLIQSPMEEECERVSRGYRCGSSEDYQKIPQAELKDIKEKADDWTLLFQMGTINANDYELMFGDCGHIYFWIRKSDLKACKFDDVWLIMQCC